MKKATLLLMVALFAACSPNLGDLGQTPILRTDTLVQVRERYVTDTLLLGPEYGDTDTIVCPPGLVRDSLIYLYDYVYLPGRKVPYKVLVHDTVRIVEKGPVSPATIMGPDYNWREHIAWLLIVISLIIGWLKPSKPQPKNHAA